MIAPVNHIRVVRESIVFKLLKPFAELAIAPWQARLGRVVSKIGLGVRAINTFLTCCRAEPLGPSISAGSPGAPEGAKPRGERA